MSSSSSSSSSSDEDNSSKFELTELLASITYQWDSYRVLFHQQNNNDNNHQEVSKSFYENILAMIYKLILTRLIPYYSSYAAFPELMHPIYSLLKQLAPHQAQPFPFMKSLQFLHLQVLEQLSKNTSHSLTTRIPLLWREKQSQFIESKNPKYHINYIIKRDREEYDQDNKEKSQLKQLTRQLKREQKAAMRELRRDADFIEQEKYKEKQALLEKQRAERQKNYQWLEEQQATINLQVKKGGELMKGGGSFVAKKPRVKR
jgi:nucleolar protein 14